MMVRPDGTFAPRTEAPGLQLDPQAALQRQDAAAQKQEQLTQAKLMELVRRLSAEINWDYAVIERLNRNDLTTTLIPFNLGKAVLEDDEKNNLPLLPGDIVTVFSKTDVAAPAERRSVVVSLEGEFNF